MAKSNFIRIFIISTILLQFIISAHGGYLGCYLENRRNRVYADNPGALGKGVLTPQKCYTLCGGLDYSYAAVASGQFCFCSNINPNTTQSGVKWAENGKCSYPCDGDPSVTCGSVTHVQVYDALKPIHISVAANPLTVPTGSIVVFEPSVIATSTYSLSMDYGTGAGQSYYSSSGTGLLNHTYSKAGQYDATVYATTDPEGGLTPVVTKTAVLVHTPVSGVSANCDGPFATYEPGQACEIQVQQGTDMKIKVDYTDGNPGVQISEEFTIGDANEFSFGNQIQAKLTAAQASSQTNKVILLPGYPAGNNGYIKGFELNAVDNGSVNVFVYRPECAIGNTYCYDSNTCAASCLTCAPFCSDKKTCCGVPVTRSSALLSTYNQVFTTTLSIPSSGHHFIADGSQFAIELGDIIGYETGPTPIIGTVSPTDLARYDALCSQASGPSIVSSSDCSSITNELTMLGAVYSERSTVLFPLTFTMPGNIQLQVEVSNREASVGTPVSVSSSFDVLEGVNEAIPIIAGCLEANVSPPTGISLAPLSTGGPVVVYWDFGNGFDMYGDPEYSYPMAGEYLLAVNVSNAVNWKYNETTVCVQERITGISVGTATIVEAGEEAVTQLTFNMATGSHYFCSMNITNSDGTKEYILIDNNTAAGSFVDHTFTVPGLVTIETTCSNKINTQSYNTQVTAVQRIKNATLSPAGATADINFNILLIWKSGTSVNVVLTYDGVSVPMTIDEALKTAVSGSRSETSTGSHVVEFTISNFFDTITISTSFVIEVAISNANIVCVFDSPVAVTPQQLYTVIPYNSAVSCTITMDTGTSVDIAIAWCDSVQYNYYVGLGTPWSDNPPTMPITYTYLTTDMCTLEVTVRNNFNSEIKAFPVMVNVGVQNTELSDSHVIARLEPPANIIFPFSISSGPVPIGVSCFISWGDNYSDNIIDCDVTKTLSHTYAEQGNFTLDWTISNWINSNSGRFSVLVLSPIVDYECYSSPRTAAQPGVPIRFVYKARRAPDAGMLELIFDCGNGFVFTQTRQSNSPDGEDSKECIYTNTGIYSASITAVSDLESIPCTYNMVVMLPVTEEFNVYTNAPVDFEISQTCLVQYSLDYFGKPLPENAFVSIDYGDGNSSGSLPFQDGLVVTYTYDTPGHYSSTYSISNDATHVTRTVPSGCYEDFVGVNIDLKRLPSLPLNSTGEPGYGENGLMFLTDELLMIIASMEKGTLASWVISADCGTDVFTCNYTDVDVLTFAVTVFGSCIITINPRNPIYNDQILTYEVEFIIPVRDITVVDFDIITKAYEEKHFQVNMAHHGTSPCVAIKNGKPESNYVYLYGDSATCNVTDVARFPGGVLHYTPVDVANSFNVSYKYYSTGSYTLEIYAWNMASDATNEIKFAVSGLDCSSPKIKIIDHRDVPTFAASFSKSKRLKIASDIDLACPDTLKNDKEWTAVLIDYNTNVELKAIDLTNEVTAHNSELSLHARFLDYGLYKLTYTVTMTNQHKGQGEFSGTAFTYINIVQSDLEIRIFEDAVLKKDVAPNALLKIAPREYSVDPDVDPTESSNSISYKLLCRDVTLNEAFTDSYVTPINKSDLPLGHVNNGGCFQQGPGTVYGFNGLLYFITTILQLNHTYEFLVFGYKGDRSGNATAMVTVKENAELQARITFKSADTFKYTSKGTRFNLHTQIGLVGDVVSPYATSTDTVSYKWELLAFDYNYKDKYDGWKNITYIDKFIEGANSKEITLYKEVFLLYIDTADFELRLTVTDNQRGTTGSTYMWLLRNSPPYNGTCTISPTEGTAVLTDFNIECNGFIDDEGDDIDEYNIYCETNNKTIDVASGRFSTWVNKKLPAGNTNNGNILSCSVSVSDENGATGTYFIQDVKVNPMDLEDFKDMLANLRKSDDDFMDYIAATATLDTASSIAMCMVSMVEQTSTYAENTEYKGSGAAVSQLSSSFDKNEIRQDAFAESDTVAVMKYDDERDDEANMIEGVLETLEVVTVDSPGETKLLIETVSTISNRIPQLMRGSQNRCLRLLELAKDNVARHATTMPVETLREITLNTYSACSNIQQAGVLAADFPTPSEKKTQDGKVGSFETNMESDLRDVNFNPNEDEVKQQAKMILNRREQAEFSDDTIKRCEDIKKSILQNLVDATPISPKSTNLNSSGVEINFMKNRAEYLENTVENSAGIVEIPTGALNNSNGKVLVRTVTAETALGTVLEDMQDPIKYSRVIKASFREENGDEHKIDHLKKPVSLSIKRDPNRRKENDVLLEDYENPNPPNGSLFFFHEIELSKEVKKSAIKLTFKLSNTTANNHQLLVLVSHVSVPNIDKGNILVSCMIPTHTSLAGTYGNATTPDPYSCFIDADIQEGRTGKWQFAVRPLLKSELNTHTTIPTEIPELWKTTPAPNVLNYKVESAIITCVFFQDGKSELNTYGCKPSILSTSDVVRCEADHLTSFAGGWVVTPNTINWDFVFSNADFLKNPTLYVTEMVIIVIYILAMIWARRRDQQDIEKLGLAPLLDNDPRDRYYYEIMVSTGMRRNGGTESKVHFILSGEEDETDVRSFTDKKREIFCRGNTDGFLMAVPSDLGALSYLRIWHDNSGKSKCASWYLNHIVVRDVQTDRKYYFICNRWFAVEEDDGQVDRVIPVAGKAQMTEFSHLFQERATKNLSDGHLWFSVVARPPSSRFTRCQRVSCCLCLLFSSMLANAMFYGTETSDSNAYQIGPFALTPEQIFIGIAANLIIFPVNFLLVCIFRKSRPRKLRPSRVEEALKSVPERSTSMTDVNPRVKSSLGFERPGSSFLMDGKRSESALSRPESSMSTPNAKVATSKKKKFELPWWFLIIGWVLLWIAVLVSAAFVTFYGITFQDTKCKKWITSMLISFFTSVFLTQPIKVFLVAIIFSLIIKNPGGDDEEADDDEEPQKKLENDEEFLHKEEDGYGLISPQRPMYKPKPPESKTLEAARKQRLKEIHMWSVIREILFYAFFLWILLVISYRSISTNSYNYKNNMQKVFILTNDTNHAFTKVKNVQDFWVWARSGMLRGLRAGPYYNNYPPFYLRGYINDKQSRLMGYATLRQLRIKPDTCKLPEQVKDVIKQCNAPYEIGLEETGDFGPGWTDLSSVNASSSTRSEYRFVDADDLNGYPYWGEMAVYGGGGYIVELRQNYQTMIDRFNQLEQENWIDRYTRAVFLEFTVYNPSINLFAISTLVSEFRPSGGVYPNYRFEPCMLLPYMSSVLLFQIICEIIYFAFTVFFVFKLIRDIYKQKSEYFFQFWNIVELGICAMSVTAIVIYFYRLVCINELTEYFERTHGNEYMKFQYVGYWTEIFNYIIGFLVYFATLKFLKLLRFNRKISLLADTLKNSARDLIHFSIIFNIVFMAFIQVFYLVYVAHLDIFKTFTSSAEAGVVMMMGKFDIYAMLRVNEWLTQIFLFLFVVTITFIVVNMFLSILNDTFGAVRMDTAKQQNDYEIVDFMLSRFKLWTGIGRSNNPTISPADLEKERNERYETLEGKIDYFPDQIDRFLASVSNMYMEKSKFDEDFLQKGVFGKMAMKAQAQHPYPRTSHPAPKPGSTRLSSGTLGMTDVQTD